MCASYGLDPRFTDAELLAEADDAVLEGLRSWAEQNAGETLRPTGKNLRNLNPLVTAHDGAAVLEPAWWGYLVDGQPARFPSINTRSERLQDRPGGMRNRALVPSTGWYEMQKPDRVWHEFGLGRGLLFGMAAVTQRGRTPDGEWVTCYSIVMRPAPPYLANIHDRMPVLIPTSFADDWLTGEPTRELIDEALLAAADLDERVAAVPRSDDKGAQTLF
ncbi:SOS response-associated peptidase family protein [Microbacterium esteraromaticum]|uniref:SOS response-associated peptidase family protein n=1 Tax=Microbacterium esteraromaticum TaxID=57043 RepID=UPI00195C2BE5|nr:SOS response-associated peptidase family protein [Microbacterium esteraromaticum]MBM7465218.1 putative SOS response-associated peptidase YedK [Microbacterium esteraromaticum]